jgi:phosphatidylglycerophosphatase A
MAIPHTPAQDNTGHDITDVAVRAPISAGIGAPVGAPVHAPIRPDWAFMRRHPAHWIALGFGSGLARRAPGTVGTLWAWALFLVLDPWLSPGAWGVLLLLGLVIGTWACTRTAQHLGTADPGAIVWDEVLGFWLVLWLWMPAGLMAQALAFGLFRLFDAVKKGPVGWADRHCKLRPGERIGWRQGFGILFDDAVAALCTLLVLALGTAMWRAWAGGGA